MRNAEAPSPIPHSEVLKKENKMEYPLREADPRLADREQPALPNNNRSRYPPPYESNPNSNQLGTKSQQAQQPQQYKQIEDASEPVIDDQQLVLEEEDA